MHISVSMGVIEGSLEVKLRTICRDGKAEVGRVRTEKSRSEKIRDGESQKREDARVREGRTESRDSLCFSTDLGLRRVEKQPRQSGGCGARWPDER